MIRIAVGDRWAVGLAGGPVVGSSGGQRVVGASGSRLQASGSTRLDPVEPRISALRASPLANNQRSRLRTSRARTVGASPQEATDRPPGSEKPGNKGRKVHGTLGPVSGRVVPRPPSEGPRRRCAGWRGCGAGRGAESPAPVPVGPCGRRSGTASRATGSSGEPRRLSGYRCSAGRGSSMMNSAPGLVDVPI